MRADKRYRLINAYAGSANISASSFRLVTSEGDRMSGDKTLSHYNVQDGDQLDVVIEQTGGSSLYETGG